MSEKLYDHDLELLRIGVIGIGWAGQQHIEAYQKTPGVEVVALAGMEDEVLQQLSLKHGVKATYKTWEDMLTSEDLDAVSVAVPTFLHAPIAMAALEIGIHVLSEKPIALNSLEGERMVEAARKSKRVLEVVFNHRYRGDVQKLRQIIVSGQLGETYYAKAAWLRRSGIPNLGSWFTNKKFSGGGPLLDLGVHVLDYSLFLLGEPEVLAVSAVTYAKFGPFGKGNGKTYSLSKDESFAYEVEDLAAVFLRLSSGKTLILETAWASYRGEQETMNFSVYGTDGGADLTVNMEGQNTQQKLLVYKDKAGINSDYEPETEKNFGHQKVIEEFVEHIRGGVRVWEKNDGSLALKRAKILDACYESAKLNKEIEVK